MRDDGAPDRIWLQLHGDAEPPFDPVDVRAISSEVTWCWEPIFVHDVKYVRADLAAERERELVGLLRIARCPDRNCDNEGTTVRMVERTAPECCGHFNDDGSCCGDATAGVEAEPEPEPCQWCHARGAMIATHESQNPAPATKNNPIPAQPLTP